MHGAANKRPPSSVQGPRGRSRCSPGKPGLQSSLHRPPRLRPASLPPAVGRGSASKVPVFVAAMPEEDALSGREPSRSVVLTKTHVAGSRRPAGCRCTCVCVCVHARAHLCVGVQDLELAVGVHSAGAKESP